MKIQITSMYSHLSHPPSHSNEIKNIFYPQLYTKDHHPKQSRRSRSFLIISTKKIVPHYPFPQFHTHLKSEMYLYPNACIVIRLEKHVNKQTTCRPLSLSLSMLINTYWSFRDRGGCCDPEMVLKQK